MEPRVELLPCRSLLVLGPHFASSLLLSEDEELSRLPQLEDKELSKLPQLGDKKLSRLPPLEEKKLSTLPPLTYQQLPAVLHKARSEEKDSYLQQWLEEKLERRETRRTPLLERLLLLQGEGALVVYSYVDQTVSCAAQQLPFMADQCQVWASGKVKGVLHPFGVCSEPSSVSTAISKECAACLAGVLRERACLLLGFKDHKQDVFLQSLLQLCKEVGAPTPLSLTDSVISTDESVLPLALPDPSSPNIVCQLENSTKTLGQLIECPSKTNDDTRQVTLIITSKEAAIETAGSLKGASFVFMNIVSYNGTTLYPLCVTVHREQFSKFWSWLTDNCQSLIECGGLGVALEKDVYIWFSGNNPISRLTGDHVTLLVPNSKSNSPRNSPERSHGDQQKKTSPKKSCGRTIPRYTVRKFSQRNGIRNKYCTSAQDDSSDLLSKAPASILARRLSLPPIKNLPQPHLSKPGALVPNDFNASTRHTMLLNKFIFGRKRGGVPVGNYGSKTIKQLLKQKSDDKESVSSRELSLSPGLETRKDGVETRKDGVTFLRELTRKRRKDLFLYEGREWSIEVDRILERKKKRWEQARRARAAATMAKQQEAEQVVQDKLADESSGSLWQHLRSPPVTLTSIPTYQNGISTPYMAGVNPYLLPQTGTSMLYPSFLSTYPFLATLPYPYQLLPTGQTSTEMLLLQNPTGVTLASSSPSSSSSLSSSSTTTSIFRGSVPLVSTTVSQSPAVSQLAGVKRPAQQTTLQQAYPNILSLLQNSYPVATPPPAKVQKKSPPHTTTHRNGNGGSGEENSKQLWQFFLELLLSGSTYSHLLRWTGSNLEFKIEDPEGLAELWGHLTMKKAVDSDQLYQTLNHYCTKTTVLSRVHEQEATFRFHPNIASYISMHYAQGQSTPASMNSSNDNCKEILVVD